MRECDAVGGFSSLVCVCIMIMWQSNEGEGADMCWRYCSSDDVAEWRRCSSCGLVIGATAFTEEDE